MPKPLEIYIPLVVMSEEDIALHVHSEEDIPLHVNEAAGGTYNYQELFNKPSINGTELVTNYDEIDPTVHEWAKEEFKPQYTASEVGAIDEDAEVSFADLLDAWNFVFGN